MRQPCLSWSGSFFFLFSFFFVFFVEVFIDLREFKWIYSDDLVLRAAFIADDDIAFFGIGDFEIKRALTFGANRHN
ncbi:MAG: hypothetical protein HIU93_03140 [Acidobacteria bacterium]|nr:hypothetical protein [Acidipila rosea]MBW4026372.1 hypothetical protein [Acidobacteriota bacterium]MBW4044493.1 hypothetical protein [Acidobacteriota bacterium]